MLKVIVVDDERFVRMGIVGETDWASLGCEVVGEAENGLDALELVHEKNPELMICDIRMPKMNGLEMLKKLREEKNPVQVIFLTAYSEFSYAREALKLYAFDYLLKPFEDGELESAILRAKERIETDRGKQRDTGLSRSVPDKAPVKGQYPDDLEGDGPEINAAVIRLCLPFDENTAGLTGYVRDAVLYMASQLRGKCDQCGEDCRCGGDQRRPPEPLFQERDGIYGDGVAHAVPDEKGSGIAFGPPEQGVRSGRKSRI